MANLPNTHIQGKGLSNFPDFESTNTQDKTTPAYNLQVAQAIYSRFVNNLTDTGSLEAENINTLRAFAWGKQSENRYKTYIATGKFPSLNGGSDTTEINSASSKKGWLNVNWQIVSLIRNVVIQIKSQFNDIDYDVLAYNVDLDAEAEEENKKMRKIWIDSKFGGVLDVLKLQAGFPVEEKKMTVDSLEELNEMKKEGFFKPEYIEKQEILFSHTENISYWDRSIKPKLVEDLLVCGKAFAYADYDLETSKVVWKYADPADSGLQYTRHNDYRDSDYGYVFEYPTISEIRSLKDCIFDKDGRPIQEEDLKELAKKYVGYGKNPADWTRDYEDRMGSAYKYDDFRVCVLKTWWIDVENEDKIEYTKKNGKKRYYNYDKTVKKLNKKEKLIRTKLRATYRNSWIVGTDYVYNFGKMPNQPRQPMNKPILPLKGWTLKEKSLVEQLIPLGDVYQVAWLKLQNAIAKAADDGYAINLSMLADLSQGQNKQLDHKKIIQLWREQGLIFYKTSHMNGMGGIGGTPIPIQSVDGGLRNTLEKYLLIMEQMHRQVELITGFSPVALGATADPNQPVGTTNLSLEATMKSLKPYRDSFMYLKEELAKVTSPMIQLALRNDKKSKEEYAQVIGQYGVGVLMTAMKSNTQYGINLQSRPDTNERQEIIQMINDAYAAKRNGVAGLDVGQHMEIMFAISNGGNARQLAKKVRKWVKEDEQRLRKEKNEAIELQGKQIERQEQAKAQNEQRKIQMELQSKVREMQVETVEINKQREFDARMNIQEAQIIERIKGNYKLKTEEMKQESKEPAA